MIDHFGWSSQSPLNQGSLRSLDAMMAAADLLSQSPLNQGSLRSLDIHLDNEPESESQSPLNQGSLRSIRLTRERPFSLGLVSIPAESGVTSIGGGGKGGGTGVSIPAESGVTSITSAYYPTIWVMSQSPLNQGSLRSRASSLMMTSASVSIPAESGVTSINYKAHQRVHVQVSIPAESGVSSILQGPVRVHALASQSPLNQGSLRSSTSIGALLASP